MTARPGVVSVAELILVTWLFALVLTGVARYATVQNRLAMVQRDRIRLEEAVRTASVVLGAELRYLTAGDIAAIAADSVRIRAFRGGGHACWVDGSRVAVAAAGVRRPDPARDSVLAFGAGPPEIRAVAAVGAAAGCPGGVAITLDSRTAVEPAYILYFESGAYYAADGAVRYRRGQGGRQPLTESVLQDMSLAPSPAGLGLVLASDPDSLRMLRPRSRRIGLGTVQPPVEP